MGTRFELVLPAGNFATTRAIGEAALAEIEDCHRRFSRFQRSSLLSHIMRSVDRGPVPVDRDTFELFEEARAVHEASEGAFDVTAPERGMDAIVLDGDACTVRLLREVPLDLGGIAKGHALDLAARVLRDHGIDRGFLHGGTSSAIGIGTPFDAEGWRVELAGGGEVMLKDRALSVSAVWEGNPHPTIDPRTGEPIIEPRRAVVIGPRARLADALSTALLVSSSHRLSVSGSHGFAEYEYRVETMRR
jgi:thiamine biosynthesis lipoprotein